MTDQPTEPTTSLPSPEEHGTENGGDPAVPRRRRRRLRVIVATVITGGLVAGGASYAVVSSRGAAEDVADSTPTTGAPSSGSSDLPGPEAAPPRWDGGGATPPRGSLTDSSGTTAATEQQQVGVVDVYTELSDGSEAAGTGMVLTGDGEILTNNHVIEGSTGIEVVVISTGDRYDASVVGTDAGDDIAVLQLDGTAGLDTVTLDTTGDVAVGDEVTGVGNAGGDGGDPSAATGSVVALDQGITVGSETGSGSEHLSGLIEVDADIISGDSGGPLYDDDTEVIGIDTAASSGRGDVTGYAIPISAAMDVADDIEAGREVGGIQLGYPAYLGVSLSDGSSGTPSGAFVAGVQAGSAADDAGLTAYDTITSFDGTTVRSGNRLAALVADHEVGDSVSLSWTDTTGGVHHATVTLGEGPAT